MNHIAANEHTIAAAFKVQQLIREQKARRVSMESRVEVLERALSRLAEDYARSDREAAFLSMEVFRDLSRISSNPVTSAAEYECAQQLDGALWITVDTKKKEVRRAG